MIRNSILTVLKFTFFAALFFSEAAFADLPSVCADPAVNAVLQAANGSSRSLATIRDSFVDKDGQGREFYVVSVGFFADATNLGRLTPYCWDEYVLFMRFSGETRECWVSKPPQFSSRRCA